MKDCCKIEEKEKPNRFFRVLRRLFWLLLLATIAVLALVDWMA